MFKPKDYSISIISYHYVRYVKRSKYPNLKALEFDKFKNQIQYLRTRFNILRCDDFHEILLTKKIPRKPSILLTFDDGYNDHFEYVYPYLKKYKLNGFFYLVLDTLTNNKVLNVNKIQFILEGESDKDFILRYIFSKTKHLNIDIDEIHIDTRFDDFKTVLIKQLLQYYLPKKIRNKIINNLFNKIIDVDEKEFSKNLYLNISTVKEMMNDSMVFGIHGSSHTHLGKLPNSIQKQEIDKSINFFNQNNLWNKTKTICYPNGSYNNFTLYYINQKKLDFGLITNPPDNISKKNIGKKYILPRLDTKEFL